jgi:hypothetical protein
VLTLRLVENPLRFAAPIRSSAKASLALGAGVTAVAVAVGQVLLGVVPVPVGHGTPATPLTVTVTPVPPGSDLATHDAAIRQAFDQVQTALTASANLGAVPSNLDPSFVGVQTEQAAYAGQGCLLSPLQGEQPECASGDTASTRRP